MKFPTIKMLTSASAFILLSAITVADKPCIERRFNHSSIVCVCNATYCDEISKINPLPKGHYVAYMSNQQGARFLRTQGIMISKRKRRSLELPTKLKDILQSSLRRLKIFENKAVLQINRNKMYQSIIGFGGAFSDSVAINVLSLSEPAQKKLIDSYFSANGLEYNMGRVPIGGSDFSVRGYMYNEYPEDDVKLTNFSLVEEDYNYKIPVIKMAMKVAVDDIYLFASIWSPPLWMKTNNDYGGVSRLKKSYYQTYADYHLKFLEEYDKMNVPFWGISTGSEPSNGIYAMVAFNSLGWWPEDLANWIANNFGPTIRNSKFPNITLIGIDDHRFQISWIMDWAKNEHEAMKYIDCIATHWYFDLLISRRPVREVHEMLPDKFLLSTEASTGFAHVDFEKVQLGSWFRAELYIQNIIWDLNNWYTAWVDWNIALDQGGGPNWFRNFVDAPIIVNSHNDEFYKQPMFYAMGHFSKFIPRNSKRIHVNVSKGKISNVAFLRPDGGVAVIFYNPLPLDRTVTIEENGRGSIEIYVPKHSVHSVVYW